MPVTDPINDGVPLERSLLEAAVTTGLSSREQVTLRELLSEYDRQCEARDRAEREARDRAEVKAREAKERADFWAGFRPVIGAVVPAEPDSNAHLPVGAIVRWETEDPHFHGSRWVKTGETAWAKVYGATPAERAANARHAVEYRIMNASPCPSFAGGRWVLTGFAD